MYFCILRTNFQVTRPISKKQKALSVKYLSELVSCKVKARSVVPRKLPQRLQASLSPGLPLDCCSGRLSSRLSWSSLHRLGTGSCTWALTTLSSQRLKTGGFISFL